MGFMGAFKANRESLRRTAAEQADKPLVRVDCRIPDCPDKGKYAPNVTDANIGDDSAVFCENRAHWAQPMVVVGFGPSPTE